MSNKKGLVIVYDSHTLQQFIWYYFTYGNGKKWDALCLPNGYKGAYMEQYCKKCGIFEEVFRGDVEYLSLELSKKLSLFCMMTGYYLVGKRKKCAKKILNSYIGDIDRYDEIVALCDTGFISGLCAMLGREKLVSYLDDGGGDYNVRTRWSNAYKKTSPIYWQSLLLDRMGYSCKGRFYFEPTKYCVKYSVVPEEMPYRNYKEIRNLDMGNTDIKAYNDTILLTYPELNNINFTDIDAVFFTDNLEVYSEHYQEYYDKCTKIIGGENKTILLKRHPRDGAKYVFPENVTVIEVDNAIPAEVILPYIGGKKIYFSYFSSIIIFMQQYGYTYRVFYSQQFYEANRAQKESSHFFPSREGVYELCNKFTKNGFEMVDI